MDFNINELQFMQFEKRDGKLVDFNVHRIENALIKANDASGNVLPSELIPIIALEVQKKCASMKRPANVEEVQDMVENELMKFVGIPGVVDMLRNYMLYRYKHTVLRDKNTTDDAILALIERDNEEAMYENSNKNPTLNSTLRDYMAGEVSKDISNRYLLPADVVAAHKDGRIHFHDSDYFAQRMHNCCLVNLKDMLENGTVITGTMIEKPKSFSTACTIATQAIAQIASSQYGGQTITLSHLAPFVDISRQKFICEVSKELCSAGLNPTKEQIEYIAEQRVRLDIARGVQTIQYQVITLMTTNGQAPFISIFMYLDEVPEGRLRDDLAMVIEEMLKQRILGVKNEKGVYVTPAFPKLLYVLDEDNISEGTKYWNITELAAKCTAKRMVPDYISAKVMKELKGDVYPCMGCRSFLTPDEGELSDNGEHKYYGRFNQGVVTLNLVDVALSSGQDEDLFWKILGEREELCKKALMCRHNRLLGTPSDVAPILWQFGALARLQKGETIDKLLFNNYSTISLGYAGLYECTKYMTGVSHTNGKGKPFALRVMRHLNDACNRWKAETNISFSLYGTPLESTTYKFAKCLQKKFGKIEGVTDKDYITNSYHVHVTEKIDAFTKLKFESEFQALSPGGAISYIEVPNMMDNIEAVLSVMQYIYDNIMYAELNTKSDYCQCCGFDGEIQIVNDPNGKLIWKCPNCGNTDQNKMNVARRTCGYIGTQFWNQGRTQEIKDRTLNVSNTSSIL